MKEWGLLVIERIHVVDPKLYQDRRNDACHQPKLCAEGATRMAEIQSWPLVLAFLDGPDLRILSIHQHSCSQQKEVIMVAGVDLEVRIDA